jgi:hypothetical protein
MAVLPQGTITFLFTDVEGRRACYRSSALATPTSSRTTGERCAEALALTRASLPGETFADEWSRGEQMDVPRLIADGSAA